MFLCDLYYCPLLFMFVCFAVSIIGYWLLTRHVNKNDYCYYYYY